MACQPPVAYSDPRDLGQVAAPLRDRLWTATLNAPRHGLILVSGKRTDYMQWLLRHERCPGRECNSACKGSPTTALPGRSNHRNLGGSVAAADMGGIDLDWLGAHEDDYGLHRPVRGEKWHFEVAGAAKVTILPYGTHGGEHPADPNASHHWTGFKIGDVDGVNGSIYKRGGLDNEIAEAQIRLKVLAKAWNAPDLDPGKIDGKYGNGTGKAVTAFKKRIIALQKANKQDVWPNSDTNVGSKTIAMLRWWSA